MTIAYAVKQLRFTFKLGKGKFGASGSFDTLTLPDGMRAVVHIENATVPSAGTLSARIYGMTMSNMKELSQCGLVWGERFNFVQVEAGDNITGTATVFKGQILEAYPDFRQPESSFVIQATPTNAMQILPTKPVSFSGAVSGETALQQILQGSGFTLENNGVNGVLSSPYFPGNVWTQALSCTRALNCFGHADGVSQVLAIWPKNGARSGPATVISPDTGLINYPSFQQLQVMVRVGYDPRIRFEMGKTVEVKSGIAAADGKFVINAGTFDLSSQLPKGPWEVNLTLFPISTSSSSTPAKAPATGQ